MTVTLLADFRDDFHDESIVELVSHRPPVTMDRQTGILSEEPAAMVGMTLSGAMLKLVDNPGGVRGLLTRWDRYCRSRHTRWPDHATLPACAQLAWMTVRDGYSLLFAADALDVSYPRAERLLEGALRQMLHWKQLAERIDPGTSHDPEYCITCRMENEERVG
jgi:hypothetical protein